MTPVIVACLALITVGVVRVLNRVRPAGSPRLKPWQKVAIVLAVIGALLIAMNPELWALGLMGDTAFFDFLVLLLSLQLQTLATQAWCTTKEWLSKMWRWMMIPKMSMSYALLAGLFALIGNMYAAVQKAVHRLWS